METARKLVLENPDGKVVRTFFVEGNTAFVVKRKDTRRLEVHTSLDNLRQRKIQIEELGKLDFSDLAKLNFEVGGVGHIRSARPEFALQRDLDFIEDKQRDWYVILVGMLLIFGLFIGVLATRPAQTSKIEQELKQQVVQLMKRVQPKPVQPTQRTADKADAVQNKKIIQTAGIKRLGALAVLGSLSTGSQKGGINLGAVNTTAGPGLGGTAGSGGIQTNAYAKGLVAAPLGAGGNLQGGGGYGTKGKGGGQAGYGKLSMVGSTGASTVPLGNEAIVGGGLDRDLIAAVIARNLGQIRFCYEQGLQGDPALNGRVAVDFLIGSEGLVKTAQVENTTLNSKMVEDCIIMRLRTWKFPLPEGGVSVKVSYPFVLRRAGQG